MDKNQQVVSIRRDMVSIIENSRWYTDIVMDKIGSYILSQAGYNPNVQLVSYINEVYLSDIVEIKINQNSTYPFFGCYYMNGSHCVLFVVTKIDEKMKVFIKNTLKSYRASTEMFKEQLLQELNSNQTTNDTITLDDIAIHPKFEQTDGNSCGPMTLLNLEILAKLLKKNNGVLSKSTFNNIQFSSNAEVKNKNIINRLKQIIQN